ncbi:site-specific tyrosine recombinase XerC [compost metagenome]
MHGNSPFNTARDKICLRLGYETGTRAQEVLGIQLKTAIDLILQSKYKNNGIWATTAYPLIGKGNKRRDIFLTPSLCEDIHALITRFTRTFEQPSTNLLCREDGQSLLNQKHASYVFTKAQLESGLPRLGHQGYHALRKSFGTNLVNECHKNGLDPWVIVPRRMGHKRRETTFGYIFFEALLNGRSTLLSDLRMMRFEGIRND